MCYIVTLDRYIRQKSCALGNNVRSGYFTMVNVVNQGGAVPYFFVVFMCLICTIQYLNEMLNILILHKIFNNKKTACMKLGR